MRAPFRQAAAAIAFATASSFALADIGLEQATTGYAVSTGTFTQATSDTYLVSTNTGSIDTDTVTAAYGNSFGVLTTDEYPTYGDLTYTFSSPTTADTTLALRLVTGYDGLQGTSYYYPNSYLAITTFDADGNRLASYSYSASDFFKLAGQANGTYNYPDSGWVTFTLASGISSFNLYITSGDGGDNPTVLYVDAASSTTTVPEASSTALALAGLGVVGLLARRRQKA